MKTAPMPAAAPNTGRAPAVSCWVTKRATLTAFVCRSGSGEDIPLLLCRGSCMTWPNPAKPSQLSGEGLRDDLPRIVAHAEAGCRYVS